MELFPDFNFEPRLCESTPNSLKTSDPKKPKKSLPATDFTLCRLMEQAKTFRDLDPWDKIRENEMIGLRDPETGEMGIVSVLGRGYELFALHYHLPPDGTIFWQRALGGLKPEKENLHMLQCEFLSKHEVPEDDLALVGKHSKISRKRRGVPLLRSYQGLKVVKSLTQSEAEILTLVFDLFLLYFAAAFPRNHKTFYQWGKTPEDTHLIPVISLKPGGSANYLADWQIERQPLPAAPSTTSEDENFSCNQAA